MLQKTFRLAFLCRQTCYILDAVLVWSLNVPFVKTSGVSVDTGKSDHAHLDFLTQNMFELLSSAEILASYKILQMQEVLKNNGSMHLFSPRSRQISPNIFSGGQLKVRNRQKSEFHTNHIVWLQAVL